MVRGKKKGQGAGLRDGESSISGRGIERRKHRLEEGQGRGDQWIQIKTE